MKGGSEDKEEGWAGEGGVEGKECERVGDTGIYIHFHKGGIDLRARFAPVCVCVYTYMYQALTLDLYIYIYIYCCDMYIYIYKLTYLP
jgi:hypothetical protein